MTGMGFQTLQIRYYRMRGRKSEKQGGLVTNQGPENANTVITIRPAINSLL